MSYGCTVNLYLAKANIKNTKSTFQQSTNWLYCNIMETKKKKKQSTFIKEQTMQCQFLFCLLIFSFHWKRFVNSGARNDFTRTINRIIYARCIKWMNTKCVPFHCLHILGGPARAKHFGFRASCYYSSHQLSLLSLLSIMLFDLKRYEFIYNIRCARTHLASCCTTPPVAIFFFIIILSGVAVLWASRLDNCGRQVECRFMTPVKKCLNSNENERTQN